MRTLHWCPDCDRWFDSPSVCVRKDENGVWRALETVEVTFGDGD